MDSRLIFRHHLNGVITEGGTQEDRQSLLWFTGPSVKAEEGGKSPSSLKLRRDGEGRKAELC